MMKIAGKEILIADCQEMREISDFGAVAVVGATAAAAEV
jgi:hypothetical protein